MARMNKDVKFFDIVELRKLSKETASAEKFISDLMCTMNDIMMNRVRDWSTADIVRKIGDYAEKIPNWEIQSSIAEYLRETISQMTEFGDMSVIRKQYMEYQELRRRLWAVLEMLKSGYNWN